MRGGSYLAAGLVAGLLLASACRQAPAPPATPVPEVEDRIPAPTVSLADHGLTFTERWVGGARPGDDVPVIVAVHGLGDTPDNFAWAFQDWPTPARVVLPQAPTPFGDGFAWATIRSGQGRDAELGLQLADAASRVAALCDAQSHGGTPPVLTGFSQGGMIAWTVAVRHPGSIARAVPVSGFLPEPLWPEAGRPMAPIFALHGDADPVVALSKDQAGLDAVQAAGGQASLSVYPGVPHTITRAMRRDLAARVNGVASAPPGEAP